MLLNSAGREIELVASIISTTPKIFFEELPRLENGIIDALHADVMDADFVPRFGLHAEMIQEISSNTKLDIDIHMMVSNPHEAVKMFSGTGALRVIPHLESTNHAHRLIMEIQDAGFVAGLAVNPGTRLESLIPLLPLLDVVTLMGINPGIVGHKLIPSTLSRIESARREFGEHGFVGKIELDGGVTMENFRQLLDSGVDRLILGAGTIFNPRGSTEQNMKFMFDLSGANSLERHED